MSDTNRYPVNPLDGAAGFAEWRRDIERRLSAVEGAPLVGSNVTAFDESGNQLVTVGKLADGSYGIEIQNASGRTIMRVTSDAGQTVPPITPWVAQTGVVSGLTNGFRPGTSSATYAATVGVYFWAVGDQVDYRMSAVPNGGNMSWEIGITEWDALTDTALGVEAIVAGPTTETATTVRNGTFTIPASCLEAGTGDDPVGRFYKAVVYLKRNSGSTTVDVQVSYFRNYGS